MNCPNCGNEIYKNQNFCKHCGRKLTPNDFNQGNEANEPIDFQENNNNNNIDQIMPPELPLEPIEEKKEEPKQEVVDIQKELEAKFDELFGSLNDVD